MEARSLKIFLITDHHDNARLIRDVLSERTRGFDFEQASRLSSGLDRLDRGGVDVLLLDLDLPDSQGLDTLIAARKRVPTVPVVILCGRADEALALEAIRKGAQDCLTGIPLEPGGLARVLRFAVARGRESDSRFENELRYKQLLGSVSDYIYTVRLDKRGNPEITTHGPGCANVTGYAPEELTTDPFLWYRMIWEEDRTAVLVWTNRLLAGEPVTSLEHQIVHKNGSVRWIRNTAVQHRDESGRVIAYDGIINDITERRQAEQALRTSVALYHSLVENSPLQVLRKDVSGRFTFANKSFCELLGRPLAEILGKTDRDFYPPELAQKYTRDDQRVMTTGELFDNTESYQAADGQRGYVRVVKTPVRGEGGNIVGTQCIFWDVTERRWAEEHRQQLVVAREIQQKLLPRNPPRVPGYDIAGASHPAEATGGDYYDFVWMRGNCLGVVIADVSGHGFGPALLAAATHACLRTLAAVGLEIALPDIMASASRLLFQDTDGDPFVTLIFVYLDPATRTLVHSNAGHPPPFVIDSRGKLKTRLNCTGCFMGISPDGEFPTAPPLVLEPGDLVLFVTDGVLEAMSPAPDSKLFGAERALAVVNAHRDRSAREIVNALCAAVRAFHQGEPQLDDITAVVIKVDEEPPVLAGISTADP